MVLICVLLFFPSPAFVNAALKTVIVDDHSGDELTGASISFLPSEAGFIEGPCRGCLESWCQGCALEPDPSKAHGGTWRVANHFQGENITKYLQFDFVGTAVTIYCIVPNLPSSPNLITQYAIDLRIDGGTPGNGKTIYTHASESVSSEKYAYDVPVFNQTGLTNEKHTVMVMMMPGPDVDAVLLFDYATYTFDDEEPPPPLPSKSVTATSSLNPGSTSTSTSDSSSSRVTSETQTNVSTSSITSIGSTNLISTSTTETSTLSTPIDSAGTAPLTPTQKSNDSPPSTKQNRLAIILGSSIGGFVVLTTLGILLIRCLRRRRDSVGSQASQTRIRPFTAINPRVRKDRVKGRITAPAASESSIHLQQPTEGEGANSIYSEDAPPDYSQRGFPL
ncbi:hypothetical protein PQX77_001634 [Marasmius sp. AFHP31]|nr:hypothetical protein PQX77_001634 [Marasmius sp. AFHP31]